MPQAPVLMWFRRDLRLADNAALSAAAEGGRPVIPVYIRDPLDEALGAAPAWRLEQAIGALGAALDGAGSRLILRRGKALDVLAALIDETGASGVCWSRAYDGPARERDTGVKAAMKERGVEARSFPGHVLFEPWTVETGQGGPYRVYSPFWRAVRDRDPGRPLPAPARIAAPADWPASDRLDDWQMGRAMNRGAAVVAAHAQVGEAAAQARLDRFLAERIETYAERRDRLDLDATSGLSENLAWGEISPRTLWAAGQAARAAGAAGAERFLQEVVWRDFAWHLLFHDPDLPRRNWRREWDAFPWREDNAEAERWRRGLTGEPVVDAAMREMYVTGRMHNRARMIVASYLTKHLLTHWRVGLDWFADCLIDWDPASNAMGWQWVAGSGPDAAPYFRVFNPAAQAERFDPDGAYRGRFLAEGRSRPSAEARAFFEAVPRSWGLDPAAPYPEPVVDLAEGRERALAAYAAREP